MPRLTIILFSICFVLGTAQALAERVYTADGQPQRARVETPRPAAAMEVQNEVTPSNQAVQLESSRQLRPPVAARVPANTPASRQTSTNESRSEAIRIPPLQNSSEGETDESPGSSPLAGVLAVITSSLAIVIGLFLLIVWLSRRAMPRAALALPNEVLEVLGKSPLAGRHHLQLIRLGQRLILISASSDGAEALAEITEPDEVDRLVGICRQNQPGSISGSFRQILDQLGTQKDPDKSAVGTMHPEGILNR